MPIDPIAEGPKFHILDVVEVAGGDSGGTMARGTVAQVRSYGAGRFRYAIACFKEEDADVAGLYDEEDLAATGERTPAALFTTFGSFRIRDVVRVAHTCPSTKVVGRLGVITGCSADDDAELFVWIDELEEIWCVDAAHLVQTGERRPPSRRVTASSLQVTPGGEIVGHDTYVVVEDVDDL